MNIESPKTLFLIKRGLLDNQPRQLEITPDYIRFQDKNSKSDLFTQFAKEEIEAYRFGIKWIKGFVFYVGREYQIVLKNKKQQILKISFKTFYGINKKTLNEVYSQIIQKLWDYYFLDLTRSLLEKHAAGERFELCGTLISAQGVTVKSTAGLVAKTVEIPWTDLGSRDYATYFSLYSISDTKNTNCSFNYKDDWNVTVLYSVIRTIESNSKTEAGSK